MNIEELKSSLLLHLSFLPRGHYALVSHIIESKFKEYSESYDREIVKELTREYLETVGGGKS